MAQSQAFVMKLYHSVIDDVIAGVRDAFLDEGVDEQVLQELRQIWETKLSTSKAVEPPNDPLALDPQPPQLSNQRENARNNVVKTVASGLVKKIEPPVVTNMSSTSFAGQGLQSMASVQRQQTTQPTTQQAVQQQPTVLTADPNKQVPIQITLPAQAGVPDSQPRVLTIQVPYSALQNNQLSTVLTGPVISATMALPQHLASSLLQQHVNAALQGQVGQLASTASNGTGRSAVRQLDGANDTSDEDEDDDDDDIDDDDENDENDEEENDEENDAGMEEEPLNSDDDVSNEDPADLFDTDNVVVCQYDKITRSRNKWKFYLKDGIMNLNGKDFVFQKSNGDAEW